MNNKIKNFMLCVCMVCIAFSTIASAVLLFHSQRNISSSISVGGVNQQSSQNLVKTDAKGEKYLFFLPYFDHTKWQEWDAEDCDQSTIAAAVKTILVDETNYTTKYVLENGGSVVANNGTYIFTSPDGSVETGNIMGYVFALPYDDFLTYYDKLQKNETGDNGIQDGSTSNGSDIFNGEVNEQNN